MASLASWLLLGAAVPYAMAAGQAPSQAEIDAANTNQKMIKYIGWTWGMIIAIVLVYRWTLYGLQHVRRLANLNHGSSSDGRQRYFAIPNERWAQFKRHWLSAPLLRRRHNREFKLSAAMNVGTLPGRMQTFFLVGYLALNVVFTVWKIDWTSHKFYSIGLHRTGILATLNMVPLFLLAGRNNPLVWLLGISFNDFNMIHRWIGRIVVFEAVAHAAFWFCGKVISLGPKKGYMMIAIAMKSSTMILTGTIGFAAFCMILLQSPSIVRHAFYETFLHLHIALAATAVAAVWIHLNEIPTAQLLLAGAIVCWVFERATRLWLIVRKNFGRRGCTKAEIEALPGDAVRVTLRTARPWKFRPGQHVYLYIPHIGMWTSHPFSLAWSEDGKDLANEKTLPMSRQDITAAKATSMSLIIRRRTGFTDALYRKAEQCTAGPLITTAYVEGPYGHESFQSYGTVMLFAAGVGISHQVPHVRDLVASYANGTSATRKVVLVWIIQSPEHLEWIRPWMTQILGMEKRRDILKILLFVTRPRSTKEIHSPSASVQMFPGKPDVGALIAKEQEKQVGAMAISVCGTGSLSDDVRRGMRDRCEDTEIDFFEEAFSW
ncbi:related to ferric-chelate reductase [Lecanosticta acicola]|uniref:ferric-chelate reductase (NADPH) n=1 Tax=Lecanosticta acicola TaxID=111012 RepID=A0AAI9ECW1_9PEZI|nr:related to ferric-chelate reductase [Lecanosticta acicola]